MGDPSNSAASRGDHVESKVFDTSGKRIWVAGHRGMVGAAVVRRLATAGCEILTVGREEVDLTRQADVERWLDKARPDAIVMAAARVGGIHANSTLPADFLFIPLMSHVAPALMRRMIEARESRSSRVEIWGSGTPRRELMFVDDAADAILFVLERYSAAEPINIGIGVDVSIRELAELIARVVGYKGELAFDAGKPDGAPRRLLDNSRLATLGWQARTPLADGLDAMYRWYRKHKVDVAA